MDDKVALDCIDVAHSTIDNEAASRQDGENGGGTTVNFVAPSQVSTRRTRFRLGLKKDHKAEGRREAHPDSSIDEDSDHKAPNESDEAFIA